LALALPMKLVSVELAHSGSTAVFNFTSADRVDFRALVKDLARRFHTRIEMRQIGVRDAARHTGGTGVCGRELCCATWLPEFKPISVRMAKDQNLSLNHDKLSGLCGRLKCCLQYEQSTYEEGRRGLPKIGKRVITPRGEARVKDVNVLKQRVRVQFADGAYEDLAADQVTRPPEAQREAQPETEPLVQLPSAAPASTPTSEAGASDVPRKKRRRRRKKRGTEPGGSTPPPSEPTSD
jgi:cell fate regulator YaaT (PSP1 superfamily)